MSRPPNTQLCWAPRRFGAAWSEFGTSRSHQQRAGAGHGVRDWGPWAAEFRGSRVPLNSPAAGFGRYLPASPSLVWRSQWIAGASEDGGSRGHQRGAELAGISPPLFLFWLLKIPMFSLLPSCSSHSSAPILTPSSALPPSLFPALS